MALSKESRLFFCNLSKIWQNFKDYTYLEGINLSPEQINIIEQEEDQLLIEGYAGTGKSLTLLYKFINVLVREQDKKILFVTFNSTLIEDTKKRLETSTEYNDNKYKHIAHVMTFHEMSTTILKQLKIIENGVGRLSVEKIKKLEGDAFVRIAGLHAKYTEENSELFKKLPKEERLYSTHDIRFVTAEIAWLKAMGFIKLDKYLSTERTGRSKSIRLTRNQRKTIFKIYELYQSDLENFKYGNRLDLEDYALKLVENKHLLTDEIKYDYIFVDEVQDLDPMQIMALCNLTKKSIVLSGDAKQRIYKKCPVKYEELGLNIRERGRRKVLNKNYRSTAEIVTLANSLNFYDSEEKFSTKQFVKNGSRPIIHSSIELLKSVKYVVSQIKDIHKQDSNKSIAIIHREEIKQKTGYKSSVRMKMEELLLQSFSDINTYKSKFDFNNKKQIFYTNAYDVKGLEFDVVFILDFNSRYYPHCEGIKKIRESNEGKEDNLINDDIVEFINTEKKLLYVAMTRAKEQLYLITSTEKGRHSISEFIYDFNTRDYEAVGFIKSSLENKKNMYNIMGNGKLFRKKEKEKEEKIQTEIIKTMDKHIESKGEIVSESVEDKTNTIIEHKTIANLETATNVLIDIDDIIKTVVKPVLFKHKIKCIDNRSKKGALWIIGGLEIKNIVQTFSKYGIDFIYKKDGGKATNKVPSWYLRKK